MALTSSLSPQMPPSTLPGGDSDTPGALVPLEGSQSSTSPWSPRQGEDPHPPCQALSPGQRARHTMLYPNHENEAIPISSMKQKEKKSNKK